VAAQRVRDINPDCRAEPLAVFVDGSSAEAVLAPAPDLLIDCIDSLGPKVALLAAALRAGIPVISSMGAALRRDPSLIRVGPLSAVRGCPLARHVRRRLRRTGLPLDFACVWSSESVAGLPGTAVAEADEPDYLVRGRPRQVLGSLPTVTGIFGLTAANEAIRRLSASARAGRT
jgi:tRNA A37 threonylcarbamoyladenosine dehydratase